MSPFPIGESRADDRPTRLAEFRRHFGDLDRLEENFLKQMSRLR